MEQTLRAFHPEIAGAGTDFEDVKVVGTGMVVEQRVNVDRFF